VRLGLSAAEGFSMILDRPTDDASSFRVFFPLARTFFRLFDKIRAE